MTLVFLMAGLFLLIYMKKPLLFNKKVFDYIFLFGYLILITLYIVNTTFFRMMSEGLFLIVTVAFITPVIIRFFVVEKQQV